MGGEVQVGLLFPAGGRVEPGQMIGRRRDVYELVGSLVQHVHVTLTGPRRIGKTTVCNAACERLRLDHGFRVIEIETPEQSTAAGFAALLADRYAAESIDHVARIGARAATPMLESVIERLAGVRPDLSAFTDPERAPAARRAALELPLRLAEETGQRVVLFLDELQRAVGYADGVGLVNDLVDIYARATPVVVLIDGSHERTLNALLGDPYQLAKLTTRRDLGPVIPIVQWRGPLRDRFAQAGLSIGDELFEQLLEFGRGHPYETMKGALHIALLARRANASEIDAYLVRKGLERARVDLDADS